MPLSLLWNSLGILFVLPGRLQQNRSLLLHLGQDSFLIVLGDIGAKLDACSTIAGGLVNVVKFKVMNDDFGCFLDLQFTDGRRQVLKLQRLQSLKVHQHYWGVSVHWVLVINQWELLELWLEIIHSKV